MVIMGDTKESPRNVDNGKTCTNTKPLRKSVMHHHAELTAGASGAAVTPSFTLNKTGNIDEDNCSTPRSTRRGRSAIHSKVVEHTNAKNPGSDTDGKHGSPSDPAAYLNSVRSNLNFDFLSSPINERHNTGTSNHGNNGSATGHKLPQKKRNRLQESGGHHKPAEVFRKDLISAMKIPDTSHLSSEEYWVMRDTWRMEWEKGVQVPVNPGALPAVRVEVVLKNARRDFRMPKKHIKTMPDAGDRDTVNLNVLADKTCRYDLDEVDVAWLKVINEERYWQGYERLDEFTMEIIMEELESQVKFSSIDIKFVQSLMRILFKCHESMQLAIKTKEGLGIEYDENIVCDVCKTPDSEDGNEMVFCDGCNLCVHQACYGIVKVPAGSWLCKPCALGIRGSAVCILCGKKGGAMKSTKSGRKWAHMSCALWIPEVNIADPARMEPITKISHIPASRWSLLCTVCKERSIGACIQCAVKHCVTAYHVTCAMENGFQMITDCCSPTTTPAAGESSVVFRSYCQRHSRIPKKKIENSPGKKSEEERRSDRQKRIAELEEQFFTLVRAEAVSTSLNIPLETTTQVMEYWKLKRKANFNRYLVTPKQEEGKALEEAAETGLQRRLKMFTHLRQDLERVRNLCYMIGRREKLKRGVVSQMREIFLEQSHYFESLMVQNKGFNPKTFLPSLTKFGSEELVKMAKVESKELAKTDEWSPETSSDEVAEPQVPDDIEDTGETIRLSRAQDIVNETPIERIDIPEQETKRKNGLIKNHKRAKSLAKLGKSQHSRPESKNDCAKKHRQRTPSLSQNPDSSDRSSRKNSVTSSDTVHESSPKHKGLRVKHRSESDNTPEADTVKDSRSSKKLRRKHSSRERVEKLSREEPLEDAGVHAVSHKETGTPSHAQKKMRFGANVELSNEPDKTSSVKRNDKEQREKPRRSPRHTTDSSDLEDFDVPKHSPKKRKMTISTETISETERIDKKKSRSTAVKILDSPAVVKKTRKRGDNEQSEGERNNDKRVKTIKQQSSRKGHENKAPSSRSTRSGSKNSESDAPTSRCLRSHSSSDESSQSARNETTAHPTKNEERALAPSSEIDNTGAECGKKEDIDAKRRSRASPSPVQELEDQKRLKSDNSSEASPQETLPSSTLIKKAPVISLEKPNMAYVAAGLNISYGSYAPLPLRQNTQHNSPTRPSGLKWVSIGEDSEMSQPLKASSQKSQDGYHGDVDETPLNTRRGNHKQTLTHKQSSTNPGKYRTGIGVFSPKCSDSSDDDFDIPIPSSSEKPVSRQKLRSISNDIRYGSSDKHGITQTLEKQNSSVDFTKKQGGVKANEPKNVRAVGGILDVQKSEPSANATLHESRTTGGDYSQDNFFEKFSLMTEKPTNMTAQPLGSVTQPSNLPFAPVSAKMLDFQQGASPFQSHSLFPFGTPINPWQVGPSTMPSIMPSQYQAYNPYTARRTQDQDSQLFKRPSPPPLPDSTLSPESSTQNSASVAVQASLERSLTPIKSNLHNRDRTVQRETIQSHFEDNEWEIVHDDDTTHVEQRHHQRNDTIYKEHRHHRKHKKRKKKKKKRKRMVFPDDYESEKRELSSPGGPIHGAIVPKGQSMQFEVTTHSSQESENTESGSEKPHKLVLKINKKDLLSPSPHKEPTTDLSDDKEAAGLKLTIKKSKYEHLMKKYKRHKHNHHSKQEVDNSTHVTAQAAQGNVKVNIEQRSGLLRRLGITGDNVQNTDNDGIGRRALRERKSILTKKKQIEPGHKKPTKHVRSNEVIPKKQKIAADSKKGVKGDMRHAIDQNANAIIASGKIPKRARGRPKKDVPTNKRVSIKQEGKEGEQAVMGDRKDLAKFAGWTTKSSNHKQPLSRSSSIKSMSSHFKPSSVGLRGRGSAVPIRSFSTDSDQNLTLSGMSSHDSQPARHWKKRKVHEHETQASEQPDHMLPHNDKHFETISSTAVSELKSNSLEGLNKIRKLPKTRSLDLLSSGGGLEKGALGHAKGHKLNQIINSLGEKASIRAVESAKTGTKPDLSEHYGKRIGAPPSADSKNLFSSFTIEKQPPALAAKGSKSIESLNPIKQRTKSESSNPTPTKTNRSDHHFDFALQTGPLNYKIPKKIHQAVNEAAPDP